MAQKKVPGELENKIEQLLRFKRPNAQDRARQAEDELRIRQARVKQMEAEEAHREIRIQRVNELNGHISELQDLMRSYRGDNLAYVSGIQDVAKRFEDEDEDDLLERLQELESKYAFLRDGDSVSEIDNKISIIEYQYSEEYEKGFEDIHHLIEQWEDRDPESVRLPTHESEEAYENPVQYFQDYVNRRNERREKEERERQDRLGNVPVEDYGKQELILTLDENKDDAPFDDNILEFANSFIMDSEPSDQKDKQQDSNDWPSLEDVSEPDVVSNPFNNISGIEMVSEEQIYARPDETPKPPVYDPFEFDPSEVNRLRNNFLWNDSDPVDFAAELMKITEREPRNAYAWYYLANVLHEDLGDRSETFELGAIRAMEKATELDPNYLEQKVRMYKEMGLVERAQKALQEQHARFDEASHPDTTKLFQLGESYRELEDYKTALHYFEQARDAGDDQVIVHARIGDSLEHLGRRDEAREEFYECWERYGFNEPYYEQKVDELS